MTRVNGAQVCAGTFLDLSAKTIAVPFASENIRKCCLEIWWFLTKLEKMKSILAYGRSVVGNHFYLESAKLIPSFCGGNSQFNTLFAPDCAYSSLFVAPGSKTNFLLFSLYPLTPNNFKLTGSQEFFSQEAGIKPQTFHSRVLCWPLDH